MIPLFVILTIILAFLVLGSQAIPVIVVALVVGAIIVALIEAVGK